MVFSGICTNKQANRQTWLCLSFTILLFWLVGLVNQLEKESQHVREHKDKQMNELKTKVQQKIQDLTSDLDARV
jgi:hypothetical protein